MALSEIKDEYQLEKDGIEYVIPYTLYLPSGRRHRLDPPDHGELEYEGIYIYDRDSGECELAPDDVTLESLGISERELEDHANECSEEAYYDDLEAKAEAHARRFGRSW